MILFNVYNFIFAFVIVRLTCVINTIYLLTYLHQDLRQYQDLLKQLLTGGAKPQTDCSTALSEGKVLCL